MQRVKCIIRQLALSVVFFTIKGHTLWRPTIFTIIIILVLVVTSILYWPLKNVLSFIFFRYTERSKVKRKRLKECVAVPSTNTIMSSH